MEEQEHGKIGELLIFLRNGISLVFAWLVILLIAVCLVNGKESITVDLLLKMFVLSAWSVIAFALSFKVNRFRKKGFMFCLSLFYLLFLPVEILLFYLMGIFQGIGSLAAWLIFAGIVAGAYVISLLIDVAVMRKRGELYTAKMQEYLHR